MTANMKNSAPYSPVKPKTPKKGYQFVDSNILFHKNIPAVHPATAAKEVRQYSTIDKLFLIADSL